MRHVRLAPAHKNRGANRHCFSLGQPPIFSQICPLGWREGGGIARKHVPCSRFQKEDNIWAENRWLRGDCVGWLALCEPRSRTERAPAFPFCIDIASPNESELSNRATIALRISSTYLHMNERVNESMSARHERERASMPCNSLARSPIFLTPRPPRSISDAPWSVRRNTRTETVGRSERPREGLPSWTGGQPWQPPRKPRR